MGTILHPGTGSRVKRVAPRDWFSAPRRGLAIALALDVAGFAVAVAD